MQNKKYGNFIVILIWLAIWEIASLIVHEPILLVGPIETGKTLFFSMQDQTFWVAVLSSIGRIAAGWSLGLIAGIWMAALGKKFGWFDRFFSPFITFLKSVPVASFVVLFLIWWSSKYLAVAISFCVVFPQIYIHTLEGLKSVDEKLLEMAKVFRVPFQNQLFYIYRPQLAPFLRSSIKISVGMAWKSGVAAEVISMGKNSIGGTLHGYKITLETAGIFALTVVIIFLSVGFEKLALWLLKKFLDVKPSCKKAADPIEKGNGDTVLRLENIWKSFGNELVLQGESGQYQINQTYYFKEPSGKGKTTRFRIIAGLLKADQGRILKDQATISYLFQEDRLLEQETAVKNVELVCGNKKVAEAYLSEILPKDCLYKPCQAFSGGMKRRVALARTFAVPSNLVLLDEPFNGLDAENRELVKKAMKKWGKNRCLLIASHIS